MDWSEIEANREWKRTYPRKDGEPILTCEAIPHGAFYVNLRTTLSRGEWDTIRRFTYQNANYTCEICGGVGKEHPVECHEVWDWNPPKQTLIRCAALCPSCHLVKHIGHAERRGKRNEAFKHIKKVNNWTDRQLGEYISELAEQYIELNMVQNWKLDISWAHQKLRELKNAEGKS